MNRGVTVKVNYYLKDKEKMAFAEKHQRNFNNGTTPKTLVLNDGTFEEYDLIADNEKSRTWKLFRVGMVGKMPSKQVNNFIAKDNMNYDPYIIIFFERTRNLTLRQIGIGLEVSYMTVWKMKNTLDRVSQYSKVKFFEKIELRGYELYTNKNGR